MEEGRAGKTRGAVQILTVDARSEGQRLDNFLLREIRGVPKTRLYRAMRKGEIRVNKGRIRPEYRLSVGDLVRIPPLHQADRASPPVVPYYWSEQLRDRVVLEDAGLIVINKPSGLAVHGGSGLDFGLIECLRQLRPADRQLELVHRLDRDTSGLILIARKAGVLKELHRLLRGDGMVKEYLALVAGRWPRHLTRIDAPLKKNTLQSGERVVRVSPEGKASITEFTVLDYLPGATLLRAMPVTGRTHQIRVHAQHAGFPILGDAKYESAQSAAVAAQLAVPRLFLHAQRLKFTLDGPAGTYDLLADLDKDLQEILEKSSI